MSIPAVYNTLLNSYFGTGDVSDSTSGSTVFDTAYRTKVWNDFLASQGLTDQDVANMTYLQQVALAEKFMQYLQSVLFNYENQQINQASPDEVKKRIIMFQTFQALLQMLSTIQDTIGAIGQNLVIYGKWQEQYTNQLTRVPIYTGGTSSLPQIPTGTIDANTDFSHFTLGYNNISIQDIADWYSYNSAKYSGGGTAPNQLFMISSAYDPNGDQTHTQIIFKYQTGTALGYIDIQQFDSNGNLQNRVKLDVPSPSIPAGQSTLAYQTQFENNFKQTFVTWWNNSTVQAMLHNTTVVANADQVYTDGKFGTASTASDPYSSMEIPWLHTYTDPSKTGSGTPTDYESKARGETNALNQQFIENVRSRRQVIQDQSSSIESVLSATKDSLSDLANLLTSIMDSLKGIISATFK